jgi:LysM repeat protein
MYGTLENFLMNKIIYKIFILQAIFIVGLSCNNNSAMPELNEKSSQSTNPANINFIIDETVKQNLLSETTNDSKEPSLLLSETTNDSKEPPPLFIEHIVVTNDTLWDLGSKYKIAWQYIFWNNLSLLSSPSSLFLGQKLAIPILPVISHTIINGETIGDISARYEVDVSLITDFLYNNVSSIDNIDIGEILYIPNGKLNFYTVTLSFYYCESVDANKYPVGDGGNFCEIMRNGQKVYPGAAACAYRFLGQRFTIFNDPLGLIYECADTGNLVLGWHRDIWFQTNKEGWEWIKVVGDSADIVILDE